MTMTVAINNRECMQTNRADLSQFLPFYSLILIMEWVDNQTKLVLSSSFETEIE